MVHCTLACTDQRIDFSMKLNFSLFYFIWIYIQGSHVWRSLFRVQDSTVKCT